MVVNALPLVGDCRSIPLPDGSVDAVVTDPPYGINFMNRAWDHDVPGPDYWREVYRVMKPGAHLLAFGGTRTWHWLTVGIEEAGFEIRDCLSWMYGTGFPKSHDISKAIDKAAGEDRKVVGTKRGTKAAPETGRSDMPGKATGVKQVGTEVDVTAPATEEAKRWDGWGTALKPAWEPIVLAMKTTDGTFAENALEHGVAGLNVDGCRIGVGVDTRRPSGRNDICYGEDNRENERGQVGGRWPANTVLSHTRWCRRRGTKRVEGTPREARSEDRYGEGDDRFLQQLSGSGKAGHADEDGTEEVEDWDCPPSCPVRQLDEQSGERPSASSRSRPKHDATSYHLDDDKGTRECRFAGDTGGASRFYYCSKASRRQREAGLDHVEQLDVEIKQEGESWESADRIARLQVDTARSRPRVIAESTTENSNATAWSTVLFGKNTTDRFRTVCTSTTKTGSSSTTGSATCGWLTRLLTSASTADAKSGTANGGSPAETAGSSITSITITTARTVSLPGVGSVASGTQLRISAKDGRANFHSTVKPIDLCRWLVRLVTRKGHLVLDPFCGSGSIGCAALQERRRYIGLDLNPEYIEIAQARLEHWAPKQVDMFKDRDVPASYGKTGTNQ